MYHPTGHFCVSINGLTHLRSTFTSADHPNKSTWYNQVIDEEDVILGEVLYKSSSPGIISEAFHRGGPRATTHFDPREVNAAIVTCGGLCPGLNNIIRELVHSLHFLYDAKSVIGVIGGFEGFSETAHRQPIPLTVDNTSDIQHKGGTILASSRGGFDVQQIVAFLTRHNIHQLYIIGGKHCM